MGRIAVEHLLNLLRINFNLESLWRDLARPLAKPKV
jgi:hypothetical protein